MKKNDKNMGSNSPVLFILLIAFFITVLQGYAVHAENYETMPAKDQLLNFVNMEAEAVNTDNMDLFVSLFSINGVIEDPVGTAPHHNRVSQGKNEIEAFYKTLVASNDINFSSTLDIVVGMNVVRDAVITYRGTSGLAFTVNAHVLYELTLEDGQLKMSRLAAHWELKSMIDQIFGNGITGFKTLFMLSVKMLEYQGIKGMLGFFKGAAVGIFDTGHTAMSSFAEAVSSNADGAMVSLFVTEKPSIEFPAGSPPCSPEVFLENLGSQASMSVSELKSAGWFSTCLFDITGIPAPLHGIAIFAFCPETKKIKAVRFYWNG